MNIGYTAPKNAVHDGLVVVTVGRGERQWRPKKKRAWHLWRAVHNVLNVRHKGRSHAFNSELALIGTGVRLPCRQYKHQEHCRNSHLQKGN